MRASRASALGQKQTFASQKAMSALLLIATTKADIRKPPCLVYPQKRTCAVQREMSAKGQKRTSHRLRFIQLMPHLMSRNQIKSPEPLARGFDLLIATGKLHASPESVVHTGQDADRS